MLKINCKKINIFIFFFLVVSIIIKGEPSEKESEIFKDILNKKINLKIDQEPLEKFFDHLRKVCKIPIVSSPNVNLQKNIQISFNDIMVKDAIYWVCNKYKLDYEIKRGALYFLDLDESLRKNVTLKVYDIRFLQQVPINDLHGLNSAAENLMHLSEPGLTIPMDPNIEEGDSALSLGKAIDAIIKNKINDGHWDSTETLIEVKGHSLKVKNIPEVQQKVENLLKQYQEKFGIQVMSDVKIISVPKKEFNEYILNELNGSNILSEIELKLFLTKKRLLWQSQLQLFSGTSVSYNSATTRISLFNRKDYLSEFHVMDGEYDAELSSLLNDDGVSILPIVNKDQSEIILTIHGQYNPTIDLITPKVDLKNQANSIDKVQVETVKFKTSVQIKNGGGVLISIGSNALKEMNDQVIVFCISSKSIKKE